MTWQRHIRSAEELLDAPRIPSSLDIIDLIKKVNPTSLVLTASEKEQGYRIKNKLQNLLLEEYGEAFHLEPHPLDERIVLIKHAALPSVDACHADLASLSPRALQVVGGYNSLRQAGQHHGSESRVKDATDGDSPGEVLKKARQLLEQYEYSEAEVLLAGMTFTAAGDLPFLREAARILVEEVGAYGSAIRMLLSQPKQFLKETQIRELLGLAYYHDDRIPEARAVFNSLHPAGLGKGSLCACATIALLDGNLSLGQRLLRMAEEMEGFVHSLPALKKEVEDRLRAEAEPLLRQAQEARELGLVGDALTLARKALERCPKLPEAKEIIVAINAKKEAAEIERLWAEVGAAGDRQSRIDLLTRLLDLDLDNGEKIRETIAAEKVRHQEELACSRLQDLRTLAEEAKWRECYDILYWFSHQEDPAPYVEACSLSPYFPVLYCNKQLGKLSEKHAKEIWLQFVEAKSLLDSGERRRSFELMEEVKEYFHLYPEYSDDYGRLLLEEQGIARSEIAALICRAESADCTLTEGNTVFGQIRKKMTVLAPAERKELTGKMKARLRELMPEPTEESIVEAYRESLLLGDLEKAGILREEISQGAVAEAIDAEIEKLFRIESEPVAVVVSNDLPVDLSSAPPLQWEFSTTRHCIFSGDYQSFIIVDLQEMTATRVTSAHFENAIVVDALPSQDTILFLQGNDPATVWRAELSSRKSSFTACFDLEKHLSLGPQRLIAEIYMSSERATEYYVSTVHCEGKRPGTFLKVRLNKKNGIGSGLEVQNAPELVTHRMSTTPEKFIVGAGDETRVCSRTLATEKNLITEPDIWEIDEANGFVYHVYDNLLRKSDFDFSTFVDYRLSAAVSCLFDNHTVMGLCPETSTAMLGLYDRCALYDFANNMVTNHFPWGRLICTRPARKWYYFDYCSESSTLTLREVPNHAPWWNWSELKPTEEGEDKDQHAINLVARVYFGYPPPGLGLPSD